MAEPSKNIDVNAFLITKNRALDCNAHSDHVKAWLFYKALQSGNRYIEDVENLLCTKGYEKFHCNIRYSDPDNTEMAWACYRQLWLDNPQLHCVRRDYPAEPPKRGEQIVVQGDWMCSIWTTLIRGIKKMHGSEWWKVIKKVRHSTGEKYSELGDIGDHSAAEEAALVLLGFDDIFDNALKEYTDSLARFIREACTLANMVIVPNGFNAARYSKTKDYWDLTMYHFVEQQIELFGENSDLDLSKLMREMIDRDPNKLFLQEWLEEKDGKLKAKLLDGHSTKSHLPKNTDDWKTLVEEMTERIKRRRCAITEFLNS